ncbi:F-box protein At2g40910-like [Panicum virgatum]|uniref:F-box protein At2g40910-like n=1 Tax=Panicum virgatum TaxID=38727 RepID=UPI0019D60C3D|nr:F-box protein At2g40910-like [Panicum virgatum]
MDSPKRSAAAVASLPDDAIVEILSRVPARSLCRFKCVSKAWRDLIADRHNCKKLPQTLEGFFCAYDGEIHGGNRGDGGGEGVASSRGASSTRWVDPCPSRLSPS